MRFVFLLLLFGSGVMRGGAQNLMKKDADFNIVEDYIQTEKWLEYVETELSEFNRLAAQLTWDLSTTPNDKAATQAMALGIAKHKWKNEVCDSRPRSTILTPIQERKLYLLCRGPRFSSELIQSYLETVGKMAQTYNSEICLPNTYPGPLQSLSYSDQNTSTYPLPGDCLRGEPDLERLMKRPDLNVDQLRWTWKTWHNFVGPPMKKYFLNMVQIENRAARNNDYDDMGQIWREELEIDDLEDTVFDLYEEIKPLYEMLHAVVRHKLFMKYGPLVIDPVGPIPIHVLGNMWGQDWSTLIDLFVPSDDRVDLDERLQSKNWTVYDMVTQAEDVYMSFGLPPMSRKFWKNSIFEKSDNLSLCHGSAANLFSNNDYRLIMCAKIDMENFYVVHHELGHIQYFMAYENQSAIFQDGANSAIHESIGDAIMNAVMAPQHLHRLGLISDEELFNKYRWDIFKGKITKDRLNTAYWKISEVIRGIAAPEQRGEEFFDVAGKFHISDNSPYIRYFLSNILQMEIYKGLCEISLYGGYRPKATNYRELHVLPLHRCDIYGSKKCGKYLRMMMEKGASITWSEALRIVSGRDGITTKPLLEYYKPIYRWLKNYIKLYKIPVGW
ncbi:hypothetical protein Trydic_g1839 [Trypoxylus dichotomus]